MKFRALFAAALVSVSLSATADFRTISRAYEVPLNIFNVPVTYNGVITFSECAECTSISARLTNNTQFIVNGRAVTLKDFRAEAFQVRNRASTFLTILHHLESDTVKSISFTRR